MNAQDRKEIQVIIDKLVDLKDEIENFVTREQEKYDNIPESLTGSEKAEKMGEQLGLLEDAFSNMEECYENLQNAIDL